MVESAFVSATQAATAVGSACVVTSVDLIINLIKMLS